MSDSERAPSTPESLPPAEAKGIDRHQEKLQSKIEQAAEQAKGADHESQIKSARSRVEQQALKSEQIKSANSSPNKAINFEPVDRDSSYQQTLNEVRRQLSKPAQNFSKVVHNPIVDKLSDGASKSIGRPSLLLGGFMAAFIGSLVIFVNAKRNGYGLSSLTFLVVLFAVGAALGLSLEIVYRAIKRYRQD